MLKRKFIVGASLILSLDFSTLVLAHDFSQPNITIVKTEHRHNSYAHYLGNEGLLLVDGQHKILFDPFFHKDFNQYQSVPKDIIDKIHRGQSPYDNISAIFISHAHDDHFTAKTVAEYLANFPHVKLIAPQQAIDKLSPFFEQINQENLIAVNLAFGDAAWHKQLNGLNIGAVRIPHAGWPGRADVQNIVFRVSFEQGSTVMHMGDADPNDEHYIPYRAYWQEVITDTAFPPYWFFYSAEGRDILNELINAKSHIGIHVPVNVPNVLKNNQDQYFSIPGSEKQLR
ncbi:MBL fold metallo-hydrolase [Thalassotalea fusca]